MMHSIIKNIYIQLINIPLKRLREMTAGKRNATGIRNLFAGCASDEEARQIYKTASRIPHDIKHGVKLPLKYEDYF